MWLVRMNVLALASFVQCRNVFVEVSAPWPRFSTSPIVEVAEYLSSKSTTIFWNYVDNMCLQSPIIDNLVGKTNSSETLFEVELLAFKAASILLSPSSSLFLETFRGLGTYLPAVRFYQSLSQDVSPCGIGNSFSLVDKTIGTSCSVEEIRSAILVASQSAVDSFVGSTPESSDHIYVPKSNQDNAQAPIVTLYGSIGTSSFCSMHAALVELAENGSARYMMRHAFAGLHPCESEAPLQGFGVFLDIKNMEYKTIDDSNKAKSDNAEKLTDDATATKKEVSFLADEEVSGIQFAKLHYRRPDLGPELSVLRTRLLEKVAGQAQEMKVWTMRDLGLQTLQSMRNSRRPEVAMIDAIQNFPMRAPDLSSIKVPQAVRDHVEGFWQSGVTQSGLGINALFVNGRRFDLSGNAFNPHNLLLQVCKDVDQLSELQTLTNSSVARAALVRAATSLGQSSSGSGPSPLAGLPAEVQAIRVDVGLGAKSIIVFLNNLETEKAYKRWPRKLSQLTQPSWSLHTLSRNLYTVICVLDPLSEKAASLLATVQGLYMQQYPIRFGVALTCSPNQSLEYLEACKRVVNTFEAARTKTSAQIAWSFLFSLSDIIIGDQDAAIQMTPSELTDLFVSTVLQKSSKYKESDLKAIVSLAIESNKFSNYLTNSSAWINARGLPINSYSLNGIVRPDGELNGVMQLLGKEQYILAHLVRTGWMKEKTPSIFSAVLEAAGAYPRYHTLLDQTKPTYIDVDTEVFRAVITSFKYISASGVKDKAVNTTVIAVPFTLEGIKSITASLTWLGSESAAGGHRLAILPYASPELTACLGSVVSVNIVNHSFKTQPQNACGLRSYEVLEALYLSVYVLDQLQSSAINVIQAAEILNSLAQPGLESRIDQCAAGSGECTATELAWTQSEPFTASRAQWSSKILAETTRLAHGVFASVGDNVESGATIVLFNSRLLRVDTSVGLHALDYELLSSVEWSRMGSGLSVSIAAADANVTSDGVKVTSDTLLRMASFVGVFGSEVPRRVDVTGLLEQAGISFTDEGLGDSNESNTGDIVGFSSSSSATSSLLFRVQPTRVNPSSAEVSVVFVLDPLTLAGQRATGLIPLFRDTLGFEQTLIIAPVPALTEFPLQTFYQSVLSPGEAGARAGGAGAAVFLSLPRQHTLTVRIDSPEAWNIQAATAIQDIDNLRCDESGCGDPSPSGAATDTTQVTYTLKSLLIAGQCFENSRDIYNRKPPNGLQLVLRTSEAHPSLTALILERTGNLEMAGQHYSDTLVMQNFGYFQLQANPGLWRLGLAAGRATQLYTVDGSKDSSDANSGSTVLEVRSFADVIHKLGVTKRPGKESVTLLSLADKDESDASFDSVPLPTSGASGGFLKSLSNIFGATKSSVASTAPSAPAASTEKLQERVHVFSLATGHMYERLLRIMMLSVSKRTSLPVKFWLLENYLSPTFKRMAEVMADKYGFEVGYVTYKWPEWLTQQTQKQRIIWGYKILFLDVLFPLSVKKVIYVDSDQVLRADLRELWELDLKGKPYAYTPFCSSRKETLGFQFWREGYWRDHLQGKPYHISALYVVDLQRFRRYAVGDQLRAIYDGLARDPNSLANLDQDLPNYAQHQVPIHSLPQEWLWCETWCSDGSKSTAKTIDLCNNPLHKEPKLDMARRIISGQLFNESWVELDNEIRELQIQHGLASAD